MKDKGEFFRIILLLTNLVLCGTVDNGHTIFYVCCSPPPKEKNNKKNKIKFNK